MALKGETKYKPEMSLKIIELMNDGWSLAEVARELKIHRDTLLEWSKTNEDISGALSYGAALSEGWWMAVGRNSLFDKDFNTTLWYRNMANRFGWRDNKNVALQAAISVEDQLKELA